MLWWHNTQEIGCWLRNSNKLRQRSHKDVRSTTIIRDHLYQTEPTVSARASDEDAAQDGWRGAGHLLRPVSKQGPNKRHIWNQYTKQHRNQHDLYIKKQQKWMLPHTTNFFFFFFDTAQSSLICRISPFSHSKICGNTKGFATDFFIDCIWYCICFEARLEKNPCTTLDAS